MNEQAQFEKQAHDALVHLYDLPYLQDHPIARSLVGLGGSESPGRVLRRILLESIQDLKPPPELPSGSGAAERYQFLYLRYVKGHSVEQIARELALSERQLYRKQREGLEAVASTLAERIERLRAAAVPAGPTASAGNDVGADTVESEADRLGAARAAAPTDLAQVLRSALATIGNLTRAESRRINLDIPHGLPPVAADRVSLRQAILGLLLYAGESSEGRPMEVALRASDGRVLLRIRIPNVTLPTGGDGAGEQLDEDSNLEVGRRLIRLQRGDVTVENSRERTTANGGRTAVIVVSLPIARPRTILIVDDNTDTLQLFTRYLEAQAHRVLTATSGEMALRISAEQRPDAVVLDVMLPSADGYEVLQALRGNPETASMPVIVCTVLKQRELALSVGATGFLAKPATQGALLDALENCWR